MGESGKQSLFSPEQWQAVIVQSGNALKGYLVLKVNILGNFLLGKKHFMDCSYRQSPVLATGVGKVHLFFSCPVSYKRKKKIK